MVAWLVSSLAVAADCSVEEAENTAEALASTPEDLRDDMAAIGISQACIGAVALAEASGGFAQGTPELRAAADLALATSDPGSWAAVCPTTPEPADRAALWEACGLEARGWFTASEWAEADGAVVIPLVAGAALEESGVPAETARALVRAVAGVRGGVRSEPGFAVDGRVEPDWSRQARKAGGVCVARIGVKPDGSLRKVVFEACPAALRDDVLQAVERSSLSAASEDGRPAPGRFEATYAVSR